MRKTSILGMIALLWGCASHSDPHDHNHDNHHHSVPDTALPETARVDGGPDAADANETSLTPLVNMYAFESVALNSDPWGPATDPAVLCTPDDWKSETTPDGDWFDVNTAFCNYMTVTQTLLAPISTGESMLIQVYFSSIEEGEGPYTVAAAIGEPPVVIWETTVEVPAEDTVLSGTWVATRDVAMGEPAYYHVSNHGINNWSLINWARVD